MALSEARKRANDRYRKRAMTSKAVHFFPKDEELLQHAMSKADKGFGAYVRDLIEQDMKRDKDKS